MHLLAHKFCREPLSLISFFVEENQCVIADNDVTKCSAPMERGNPFFPWCHLGQAVQCRGPPGLPEDAMQLTAAGTPPGDRALAELTVCACMKYALCSDAKPFPNRDNNKGNNKLTSTSVPLPWPTVAFHRSCFTSSLLSLGCAEWQLEITLKDLLQAMMNCLQMGCCPLQSR